MRTVRRRLAVALSFVLLAACSDPGPGGSAGPGEESPAIAVAVAPAAVSAPQGGSATTTATVTRSGGFTGAVTVNVTGLPAGVTATVTPQASGGVTTAIVALQVGTATPTGTHALTVRATGSGVTAVQATLQLTVTGPTVAPDYALSVTPVAASVVQGGSRDVAVAIARSGGFSGAVALALGGTVPAGVGATFAPASVTGTGATMTLAVGAAVAPGVYPLQIAGTGTPGARTTPFTLTVTAAGNFTLSSGVTGPIVLAQGASDAPRTITIARTDYDGAVTLTAENLPAGVNAVFGAPGTGTSGTLTLTAQGSAAVGGPHVVTIRGTGPAPGGSGTISATTSVTLHVTAPVVNLALGMPAPCAQTFNLPQGALDDRRIVAITRTGIDGPVDVTVEGAPAGLAVTLPSGTVAGDQVRLTVNAAPSVAAGSYPLTVRARWPAGAGAGAALNRTLPLTVTVTAATAADPARLSYDFDDGLQGWLFGRVCAGAGLTVDWGDVIAQEQMFVLLGRSPQSGSADPDAWVGKLLAIPPGDQRFVFDASAHYLADGRTRVRVRVVDGGVSTVIFTQTIASIPPDRVFVSYAANLTPWAGKTVRIFVEHFDEGASHVQLWLDNFRVVAGSP